MKLNSMQKYNLKWAKDKLRSDKKNARDMLKIYKQQKKEICHGLLFLNFETECHLNYGDEYVYNEIEQDIMLKNYRCKKHFENLKSKWSDKIKRELDIINRDITFYIDENYNFTHNN